MKMPEKSPAAKDHYDRFLSEHYCWMAGGFEENCARIRSFSLPVRSARGLPVVAEGLGKKISVNVPTATLHVSSANHQANHIRSD